MSHYFTSKQYQVGFQKSLPSKKSHVSDLIYIDVCTIDVRTLIGALYFVTFIYDHSRFTWLFLMKAKSEVFQEFEWEEQ